jgi:hypothetical protein
MIVEKTLFCCFLQKFSLKISAKSKKSKIAACDNKISVIFRSFSSVPNLTDPDLPYLITENLCLCKICLNVLSRKGNFFCKFKHFHQYFLCMH